MLKNKLIDKIINEPLGGAHYDPIMAYNSVKENIVKSIDEINSFSTDKMILKRRKKFTSIGKFKS
jgi:acetyl-CoA carboxylase carboxyl transferase subunit alpha